MESSLLKEDVKWEKIHQHIKTEVVRTFEGKRVVSRAELAIKLNVSDKTIQRYAKDGMPTCEELWSRNFQIFYFDECVEWKEENIDRKQSKRVNKHKEITVDTDFDSSNDDNSDNKEDPDNLKMSQEEGERREKRAKAMLAEIKLSEAKGLLIPADDLDKAMYEQAIMHKTDKTNDEKILPVLLEMKTTDEIRNLLEDHNDDRLELLDSQIEQRFKKEPSNYEIFEAVLQSRKKGNMPKDIIRGIEC